MHRRLDYYTSSDALDFTLVFPPSTDDYSRVSAYHQEFRRAIDALPPESWVDSVLFSRCKPYYQRLQAFLHPDILVEDLESSSRHRFYVSEGQTGEILHLSGLQRLLNYEEIAAGASGPMGPTLTGTGRPDLDVISSLILLQVPDLSWLVSNYSVDELGKVAKYLWEQKAASLGQTPESVHEQDRQFYAKFAEANPGVAEQARTEAQQLLLMQTGPAALDRARMEREERLKRGETND